jgi:flagellar basal-body rod modification protein FlgD
MVAVTPTSSAPSANPPSQAASAAQQLSGNFDTFLTLLTTQLQNQDPLSPMDSNQFTQQLVEFSQVEQQINSNQNLETLIALAKSQNTSYAVSYLGKSLTTTDGSGALANGQATWNYTLNNDAVNSVLTVSDSRGKLVYVGKGETAQGQHSFVWDGKDNNGNPLPSGTYTLNVTATGSDGSSIPTSVSSQGVVTEVDLSGSEPMLMVGPMAVPLSKATLISAQ